ncbi:MAG: class I SAM-dependent methyltransferase [Bacteroidota bacterium]|jgi:SAM-dependent methyltransferase
MEEFERTPCLICGSEELHSYSTKGQFGLPTHVVICKNCGFSFLNPRWTKKRYHQFYSKEYDKFYREETVSNPNSELEFNNIKAILNRLNSVGISLNSPKSILDIGCGMGHSLIYLKCNIYKNSKYYAIEPSELCVEHLENNGINVLTNDVYSDWNHNPSEKFDFIIMRHVLEHFNDPVQILKKVTSVLSENGILYLAVPDAMNPTKPLKTNYFRVVHVSYFSKKSISNALNLSGLLPVSISEGDAHEPYEIFAFCKRSSQQVDNVIDSKEWEKQKRVYDLVGKSDFYYTQKFKLIRLLKKIKLLK